MIDMPDFTTEQDPKKTKKLNQGKIFEKDFKDSIPEYVFQYRFKDGTAAWGNQENTRFQHQNICDTMLFYQGRLYLLELKTVKGKSFSFNNVRDNQITELKKASEFEGITAGFIINFRDYNKTVFIEVNVFIDIMERNGKKSFNLKELEYYHYTEIKGTIKRTRYKYDIGGFING